MPAIDHSLTYRQLKFRNIPHYLRLKNIFNILNSTCGKTEEKIYLDIGCSNGYLTNKISELFNFKKISGMDHALENIEIGKKRYPHIDFQYIDLNRESDYNEKYDVITCLETLEHVGNLENAITSILNFSKKRSGTILISVPTEIGLSEF